MIFNRQIEIKHDEIESSEADLFFYGSPLDDRGALSTSALNRAKINRGIRVNLDAEIMTFCIDDSSVRIRNINSYLDIQLENKPIKKVFLDATTLGVPEILYILRWLARLQKRVEVDILYVEPESYPPRIEMKSEFGLHQFKLSHSSVGYRSLPGFTKTVSNNNKTHLIALLGFERVRLGQLLTNDEGAFIENITPIFGVPSFKPSYDKHTIFQNIDSLKNKAEKPKFSSANNPYDTYKLLQFIYKGLQGRVVNIAPIGTKPMAIGACIFILQNLAANVGVMYDHPQKSLNRTKGFSRIHLYSITI
ncbi:hypothetical protein [Bowmanella dokdonensis]|uniref:Uncharacterized protein n=1 Tax=Bowmanella dokdonensis TaxID=751969 RepID=A0A939DM39_9ALTE|nr:hypothetical protein [Bowmanella dokdonensis]MBN7825099.1 hypothetical protein [Bowmanella dokdonensis]